MRRSYSWGQVDVLVEAGDDSPDYMVSLISSDFRSTPIAIDAHWGADHAARISVEIYYRALKDPRKFLAEERMEARHMSEDEGHRHEIWTQTVVHESEILGYRLEEAVRISLEPEPPIDVTERINRYLELTQFGHDIAIGTLIGEGYSISEARRIHSQKTWKNILTKWRLVPGRRLPTAARG